MRRRAIVAVGIIAALLAAGLAAGTPVLPVLGVRVCTSTMTDEIAAAMVGAYSKRHAEWPYHYVLTRPGDLACDVRFFTASEGHVESIIARDAVVAVVNPHNAIARLDVRQARRVLAGQIVDWGQLGERTGPIAATISDDASDETREVAVRIMSGLPFAARVVRMHSAAEIVRWVSSPGGTNVVGFVPFSAALPAKVLTLGGSPAPSTRSILDERYPMSLRIVASSDFRSPSRPAAALIAFARSKDGANLLDRFVLPATPRAS